MLEDVNLKKSKGLNPFPHFLLHILQPAWESYPVGQVPQISFGLWWKVQEVIYSQLNIQPKTYFYSLERAVKPLGRNISAWESCSLFWLSLSGRLCAFVSPCLCFASSSFVNQKEICLKKKQINLSPSMSDSFPSLMFSIFCLLSERKKITRSLWRKIYLAKIFLGRELRNISFIHLHYFCIQWNSFFKKRNLPCSSFLSISLYIHLWTSTNRHSFSIVVIHLHILYINF